MTGRVWRRSSRCNDGYCVEVAGAGGRVLVRDSKLGDGSPVLEFDAAAWQAFIAGIKAGELTC